MATPSACQALALTSAWPLPILAGMKLTNYTFRVDPSKLPRYRKAAKRGRRSLGDWIRLALDAASNAAEPEAEPPEKRAVSRAH